ncbi:transcription repressor OFP13-like [Asparagus officinalis]|uniref:transcription repressor OFP13-like n=1 Tax=Asparagus officinalis TaxID=4686 RepID=UPI00098E56A8|nr:transcription repressor OFP13-like [Asparagus officinalis]
MEMESEDPYGDFRRSMEEMVAANEEMREWESLEQLLVWYLRVNGKRNHGFIVGAFVDLLVALAASCDDDGGGGDEGKETGACCDSAATSVRFEIEEVEEGSGSC